MNFHYPIFLDVTGKQCLVTGEHAEIAMKIQGLRALGARVFYVNPQAAEEIAQLAATGEIVWQRREFTPADLDGCFLVIAALPDNSEVFRLAEQRNILCNAIDDAEHCRFTFGSVHRQGDLTVAISTNGAAPALAVRLKEHVGREFGPEYAAFIRLLKEVRAEVKRRVPDFAARRALWYQIVDSEVLEKLRAGDVAGARRLVQEFTESAML